MFSLIVFIIFGIFLVLNMVIGFFYYTYFFIEGICLYYKEKKNETK